MKKYSWIIVLLNLVLFMGLFNYSVVKKERLLSDGKLILLELAPVDPRSLMQGDYMDLRYAISDNLFNDGISKRGFCVVRLDADGVGQKVRIQDHRTPKNEGELLIEYTSKKWFGINIGAESFFFQEGQSQKYEDAKYGGIRVDDDGNSILVGLYDANRKKIE
ncbi:MAG: GDYXXLXY domain-containing protein [Allomuricauda sp.]